MPNATAEKYRELIDRRSADELRTLAHLKRFSERYLADPRFRELVQLNGEGLERTAAACGIKIDLQQVLPLFLSGEKVAELSPVARVWHDYMAELTECNAMWCRAAECAEANPLLHFWRQRQIRRCNSELVESASMTHPILAFELSAGCSVGCWFCGVSAERFQGNFAYTEHNALLWREILGETIELFGTAAQSGFCYWATDPSDNPDYPKFIEDFYLATGTLPETTTAAPMKNIALTRELMRLFDKYRCMTNRFSILNLKTLDAVHAAFTAEELLNVELVLQNSGSLTFKAAAGRARERRNVAVDGAHSTIACVSGFLVNMVKRTIKLITPTAASDRWPLGYRVFGERRFATKQDFRIAIEDLISTRMRQEIKSEDVLSFRQDLSYTRTPEGFVLENPNHRFKFGGFLGAGKLGDMIHQGATTAGTIQSWLTQRGADVFVVADSIKRLFDAGLIDEDALGPQQARFQSAFRNPHSAIPLIPS